MNASTPLYVKPAPLKRTIYLPFTGEVNDYLKIVGSPLLFRSFLQETFSSFPELFPSSFSTGFSMKDIYISQKLHLPFRRITIAKIAYSVRFSFALPYMTALAKEVSTPLFLRKFAVPFWALSLIFKRSPIYFYRLECSIGLNSLVATTITHPSLLPKHLCADEKIAYLRGESLPLAMTVAQNCVLGIEPSLSLKEEDLKNAYSVFKQESQALHPKYSPKTVNLDGWTASWNVWHWLFPKIVIIRCFLHLYLKLREVFQEKQKLAYEAVANRLWGCYKAESKSSFSQRVRRVIQWSQKQTNWIPKKFLEVIERLEKYKQVYAVAYDYEGAYRTSNQADRLMQRLEKRLYETKYFKGTIESARLNIRGWALIQNFAPWNPFTIKKYNGWQSPAENLNQKRYHIDWLQNLLVSASVHRFQHTPQNLLQ